MSEQAFQSPFIRYAGTDRQPGEDVHGPYVSVVSQRNGLSCRLSLEEDGLCQIFDGQRNAAQRLQLAQQRFRESLSAQDMERFCHMLTDVGLLWAGSEEALPVPPQTESEHQQWSRMQLDENHEHALPPSTSAGSLAGPGLSGPIASSPMRPRDGAERIDWEYTPTASLMLGRIFSAPIYWPLGLTLTGLVSIAILVALWFDQQQAASDFSRLLQWKNLVFVGLPAALLTSWVSHLSRAAVIQKESGQMPRFGMNFVFGFLPRFMTDTEGPAELLNREAQARVLKAALTANLLLFTFFLLGWFLSRQATNMLPSVMITAGIFGLGNALLRLNPLARTDGYYLLAFKLGVPDLREQAVLSLLGRDERWGNKAAPPRLPVLTYGLLTLVFLAVIIGLFLHFPARWLDAEYGGAGMAVLISALLLYGWHLKRQFGDRRGQIGSLPMRSRLRQNTQSLASHWRSFALFAVAALWPYTYEPGGRFQILPLEKAEVPAEISGVIHSLHAKEGDWLNKGDLIARIDDSQLIAQKQRAEADLLATQADLLKARNGATAEEIALAKQRVSTAQARLQASETEAKRAENAHARRAITAQDKDQAVAYAQVLNEELADAQRQLDLILSDTREEEIAALEAELKSKEAELRYVDEQLQHADIRAPIAGSLIAPQLRFSQGRYVEAGEALASVENTRELEAELRLPEFAARYAQVGAPAQIKAWTQPNHAYVGQVKSIAPSAELGENGRVVRVLLSVDNADGDLLAEMSGQAKIQAETGPAIVAFSRAILRFVRIEVWSWLP